MISKVTRAANESLHALVHRVRTARTVSSRNRVRDRRCKVLLSVITLHRAEYSRSMAFRVIRR